MITQLLPSGGSAVDSMTSAMVSLMSAVGEDVPGFIELVVVVLSQQALTVCCTGRRGRGPSKHATDRRLPTFVRDCCVRCLAAVPGTAAVLDNAGSVTAPLAAEPTHCDLTASSLESKSFAAPWPSFFVLLLFFHTYNKSSLTWGLICKNILQLCYDNDRIMIDFLRYNSLAKS